MSYEAPWIEKYRPELLQDIVGNAEAIDRLRAIASMGNLPNLILSGPPGTGKTTSILCLAREMLGDDVYKQAVLELNASDARGIDVVRNKIKMFAQKKVTLPPGRHKVVILDEADSMTASAQQALRRTMEIYSHTTRFALACNNSTKIIEPIQSRCAVLRYTRLTDAEVLSRIQRVCHAEQVASDSGGLEAVVFLSEGDMRQALNALQATVSGFGLVTADHVFKVCDMPQPVKVRQVLEMCVAKQTNRAVDLMQDLLGAGYAPSDLLQTLFKVCRTLSTGAPGDGNNGNGSNSAGAAAIACTEAGKLQMLREIGMAQMRVSEGLQTKLQVLGCVARLCLL